MTPVYCSGCGDLLLSYNEETIGKAYLGTVLHINGCGMSTKINKWFGNGE